MENIRLLGSMLSIAERDKKRPKSMIKSKDLRQTSSMKNLICNANYVCS